MKTKSAKKVKPKPKEVNYRSVQISKLAGIFRGLAKELMEDWKNGDRPHSFDMYDAINSFNAIAERIEEP